MAILLGLMLMEHHFLAGQKAVMLTETPFFGAPAYASEKQAVVVGPGSTVNLLQTKDIWAKVQIESKEGWVPIRSIKAIQAD